MKYLNQLEPTALIDLFLDHPPLGFHTWQILDSVPAFSTKFHLLTTVDIHLQRRLQKLPGYTQWQRWLQLRTGFVGTTVSEYALFNPQVSASEFAAHLQQECAANYPLWIVKDIPLQSPLLSDLANDYAQELVQALQQLGFIAIEGQALAWVEINFSCLDDYLSRLSSGRRKDFRRKLKMRDQITTRILHAGDACFQDSATCDLFYQLYLNVYEQSEIHFDKLSADFFAALLKKPDHRTLIFTYYQQDKLIGYNICFIMGSWLIDKYIGFDYPAARKANLYYLSWFYNLEYALQHGLSHYVAGWTDPAVKAALGAQFTFTKHLVYVRNPLLRGILRPFSRYFEADAQWKP